MNSPWIGAPGSNGSEVRSQDWVSLILYWLHVITKISVCMLKISFLLQNPRTKFSWTLQRAVALWRLWKGNFMLIGKKFGFSLWNKPGLRPSFREAPRRNRSTCLKHFSFGSWDYQLPTNTNCHYQLLLASYFQQWTWFDAYDFKSLGVAITERCSSSGLTSSNSNSPNQKFRKPDKTLSLRFYFSVDECF